RNSVRSRGSRQPGCPARLPGRAVAACRPGCPARTARPGSWPPMTASTITEPQLALARSAAEAALAVLPTSRSLTVGGAVAAAPDTLTEGQAITARFTGAATGEVVVVVGQDLADALKESPLGELDLTAAVRPALEAAARVFGPVVLDPGQMMEPGVALSAIAAKDGAVTVPLLDGGAVGAVLALA